ncbi:NADH dehydrogenase [ubiquinone] 1 alpha subcomplex subunit 9, mitochondrial isoform X3 [Populus alba]|uniref:NADH dehydrogenase [ubiquinone] 1 alpha subcomplex subunit 9, mitochondrial isoform X3 n=1 Tax=Populus alba TaxID=43335 RepID=UPI003CC6E40B
MVDLSALPDEKQCSILKLWSFEELNHGMAEQFAMISRELGGIIRFIQVSCLGASASSPSRVLRAKAAGEEAVLREMHEQSLHAVINNHENWGNYSFEELNHGMAEQLAMAFQVQIGF